MASTAKPTICCICRLRWCHTDLGANVLHWPKLLAGNHRFGELAPFAGGLSAEHFDGVLVHKLLVQNWVVAHLNSSCLCDHSPSPQVKIALPLLAIGKMTQQCLQMSSDATASLCLQGITCWNPTGALTCCSAVPGREVCGTTQTTWCTAGGPASPHQRPHAR